MNGNTKTKKNQEITNKIERKMNGEYRSERMHGMRKLIDPSKTTLSSVLLHIHGLKVFSSVAFVRYARFLVGCSQVEKTENH